VIPKPVLSCAQHLFRRQLTRRQTECRCPLPSSLPDTTSTLRAPFVSLTAERSRGSATGSGGNRGTMKRSSLPESPRNGQAIVHSPTPELREERCEGDPAHTLENDRFGYGARRRTSEVTEVTDPGTFSVSGTSPPGAPGRGWLCLAMQVVGRVQPR
jgi:hypothetical protein